LLHPGLEIIVVLKYALIARRGFFSMCLYDEMAEVKMRGTRKDKSHD
jgi:hypothetical protein